MNKDQFTTCKLIFDYGITKEDVTKILAKYTSCGTIATFEPDITVGCNRTAFAVVDVPMAATHRLVNDGLVKEVDTLATYSKPLSMAESCKGGCCGGGCSS